MYRKLASPKNNTTVIKSMARSITTKTWKEITHSAKGIEDIPCDPRVPIISDLLSLIKYHGRPHHFFVDAHRKFGSIFRMRVGIMDAVCTIDTGAIEKFFREEGLYPKRIPLQTWFASRAELGTQHAFLTAEGETWRKNRKAVNKSLLRLKEISNHAERMNEVIEDFMDVIRESRDDSCYLPNIDKHLCYFSFEIIGAVLFGKRIGCLSKTIDPQTTACIQAAQDLILVQDDLEMYPLWVAKSFFRKSWRRLLDVWDILFKEAKKHVDFELENMEKEPGKVPGVVRDFATGYNLTKDEIYAFAVELMAASVPTTSSTVQFLLYELARDPQLQEEVHKEVTDCLGNMKQPSANDTQNMSLLRGVFKETMRLYPVGTVLSRITTEDTDIQGYHIPAKTSILISLYALGRSPALFRDPDTFRPQRWFREPGSSHEAISPFSFLPFGFGSRMCIGRRLSELEVLLLVAQMVRRFKIQLATDEPLTTKVQLLFMPAKPPKLRFIDR